MHCHEIETRIRSYIDGELIAAEEPVVRAHLTACARCLARFEQVSAMIGLLQDCLPEEPPPHFTTSLQVRLARLREERRRRIESRASRGGNLGNDPGRLAAEPAMGIGAKGWGFWRLRLRLGRTARYGLSLATMAAVVLGLFAVAPPRIGAQELAVRVQASWARLRNYQCTFVSRGIVRGEPREFEQRQWFMKPDLFRLETREHYALVTYVQRDRVGLFIPGADWNGKPVAVLRARKAREPGLPYPFGSLWPETEEITIDALVRQLRVRRDGEVLGTETVLGKPCYVLRFEVRPPAARRSARYLMWIDQELFLPLRMVRYEDAENHLWTEAVDLKVDAVFPSDTFRFQPPAGTFVARGDLDPDVFALKPSRTDAFERWPVRTGRQMIASRGRLVSFQPVAPTYLPPEYELLRVRAARDRWLDAYWVDSGSGRVVKLVEQAAGTGERAETRGGGSVAIPTARGTVAGRLARASEPYPHHYVTWEQDGVSALLATAELPLSETLRIAGSMELVATPPAATVTESQSPESRPDAALAGP
jgi:outer membrane lipoprotein-sorting protein